MTGAFSADSPSTGELIAGFSPRSCSLGSIKVVNYLIFREKVPEFSPQSLQGAALFEGKKV
ncbi:MAG: hypothetical protein EWV57_07740 [Microcystis aeruginosa Ma_QC_Ch_20071001_S25D]|uniref:Uncharacterized protein n=1 Tax=Microcystis aeruginosa Ma_QC_Ch_20071001_S25D TaxID=2486250 RepID=A0A552FX51_MICAE|nr:MAG: hypothetical protein EWV57_07740 [Microcystis aeruginosa Ma_QC_Ch_20071001_S25D]